MGSVKVNGAALEAIRIRSGLSLRDLAKLSGVSFRYIRSIETGTFSPSWLILSSLATALKVPTVALLADPVEAAPPQAGEAS